MLRIFTLTLPDPLDPEAEARQSKWNVYQMYLMPHRGVVTDDQEATDGT